MLGRFNMDRLDELLRDAKPYYHKRKRMRRMLAATSSLCVLCFVGMFSFNLFYQTHSPIYDVWTDEIEQLQVGSVIEDLGLPVDEYGLLKVV